MKRTPFGSGNKKRDAKLINAKRARTARILKEATHLLVFVGPRSRSYEQTGIRYAKKGKQVFLIEPNPIEMVELVVE